MFFILFCIVNVFLELYSGVRICAGQMCPETCIELRIKIEVGRNREVCQKATMRWCLCWPWALLFRSMLLVVDELNLLKSFPPCSSAEC